MNNKLLNVTYWIIFVVGLIPAYFSVMTVSILTILITVGTSFLLFAFALIIESRKRNYFVLFSKFFYATIAVAVIVQLILVNFEII